jgi:hypothetical protein
MNVKTLGRGLIVVAALVATSSFAASHAAGEMKAGDMMKMPMMDTNKDGMVSKEEFLAAMGKAFDMHAKSMGAKDGKIDAGQLEKLRSSMFMQ